MPEIETERLLLRMFRPDDLNNLAGLFSDPEVMRYVGGGVPVNKEETGQGFQSIIKHTESHRAVLGAAAARVKDVFVVFARVGLLFGHTAVVYHFTVAL